MTNSERTQKHLQTFCHSISDQAFVLIFYFNLQYLCNLNIKVTLGMTILVITTGGLPCSMVVVFSV